MFLAVDVGNTQTTLGLLDDAGALVHGWRMATDATDTSDMLHSRLWGYFGKDGFRHWKIVRLADDAVQSIGDFWVPPIYRDIYCRCDLHPRWRKDGKQLAFNSVHEGSRQVYLIDVSPALAP